MIRHTATSNYHYIMDITNNLCTTNYFFHDGETGQLILPVLRPGNCHSNRWFVHILSIMVKRIRTIRPDIEIFIRADAGFSNAEFYKFAEDENIKFCVGLTTNSRLKKFTETTEEVVRKVYLEQKEKYQFFAEHSSTKQIPGKALRTVMLRLNPQEKE